MKKVFFKFLSLLVCLLTKFFPLILGGGLCISNSILTVQNSTLKNNNCLNEGGAVHLNMVKIQKKIIIIYNNNNNNNNRFLFFIIFFY